MKDKSQTLSIRLTEEVRDRLERATTVGPYRVTMTEIIARGIELAAQELDEMAKLLKRSSP